MAQQELIADQVITQELIQGGNVRVPNNITTVNFYLQPQIPLPYGDGGFRCSIEWRSNAGQEWTVLGAAEVGPADDFPDRGEIVNPRLILGATVPDMRLNRAFVRFVVTPVPLGVDRRIGIDFETL